MAQNAGPPPPCPRTEGDVIYVPTLMNRLVSSFTTLAFQQGGEIGAGIVRAVSMAVSSELRLRCLPIV